MLENQFRLHVNLGEHLHHELEGDAVSDTAFRPHASVVCNLRMLRAKTYRSRGLIAVHVGGGNMHVGAKLATVLGEGKEP